MKLQKPFDPIGLGNLLDVVFIDEHEDGIDTYQATEKDAAKPFVGKMWIAASVLYGHFNGPKRKIAIITDGDNVCVVKGSYINTLKNRKNLEADPALKKFVLGQIGLRLF